MKQKSNNTVVRHVLDARGKPLCGRTPSYFPPEADAPVCSVCKRSRAFRSDLVTPRS